MRELYVNPLSERYASEEMQKIFSPDEKFSTFRKLWIALAEAEKELGLDITDEQIEELKQHIYDIDYDMAAKYEKELRHDVMAHIKTYCSVCPKAAPIIHLGATSCYVDDNTDIIVMKKALLRVRKLLVNLINSLAAFAMKHKGTPTLAYTHFQPAQPTTVGKRATLYIQDLMSDLDNLDFQLKNLKLLGCKGTTGTSASFLKLFDGDKQKAMQLENIIAEKMGFDGCVAVSGQTYSRKTDYFIMSVLSGIAQSASKFAFDTRLLSHMNEFDEPFESSQVGSSAMAYKRNPMRSERICSLARFVISNAQNEAVTAATQWFERTLDDSANRRITLPEAFLAVDGILSLYINVVEGGTVYPKVMDRHLEEELPYMATENILMYAVKKGGNRQLLHEKIREYSVAAKKNAKLYGDKNNVLEKILADKDFNITKEELDLIVDKKEFIGLSEEQTEAYLNDFVYPMLEENKELLGINTEIRV